MSLLLALTARAVPVVPPSPDFSGGFIDPFPRNKRSSLRLYHDDEDDDDKPDALEVIKIGDAPKRQIITGIVAPVRKARAREAETLKRLSRQRVESERARAEHIRRIIAADDEWLMTV